MLHRPESVKKWDETFNSPVLVFGHDRTSVRFWHVDKNANVHLLQQSEAVSNRICYELMSTQKE